MTAIQIAHFRLMTKAANEGRVTTHIASYKVNPPNIRAKPCIVNGTEYDSVTDAMEGERVGEKKIRELILQGKGRYID